MIAGDFLRAALLLVSSGTLGAAEFGEDFITQELLRTQSDPDSEVTLTIEAPLDFVFEFLATRLDEYVDDAVGVSFDHSASVSPGSPGAGSVRITTMENGATLVQRFLEYQPPHRYAYFTDMDESTLSAPLKYSLAHYELTEVTSTRTRLRLAVVYESSSRLLSYFVRRGFASALARDMEKAVASIEREIKSEAGQQ